MKLRPLKVFAFACFLLGVANIFAGPLSDWTWRFPNPQGNILEGVTYGGGQFIAVGDNGTIINSPDGIHWSNQVSGVGVCLRGVAYADGEYAAVGDNGVILVSPDGIRWTQAPIITSNNLRGVAGGVFGPPAQPVMQFLAVGNAGTAITCDYGTNWHEVSAGTNTDLYGVAWRNGSYIAVGDLATVVLINGSGARQISADNVKAVGTIEAVANGPVLAACGNLRAAASAKSTLTSSVNGFGWDVEPVSDDSEWGPFEGLYILTGMSSGPFGFVAVGVEEADQYVPGVVVTSANNENWAELPPSVCEDGLNAVAYGNGTYVGVGDFGSIVVSTNTANWTEVTPDRRGFIIAMACNSNLCIACAGNALYSYADFDFPDFDVIVSTNAADWSVAHYRPGYSSLFPLPGISDIACSSTKFVAVGDAGSFTTADGYSWETNSTGTNALYGIKYMDGRFFAVGANGSIYSSLDGLNWANHSLTTTNYFYASDFGNGIYVSVGNISAISSDGVNWQLAPINPQAPITKLAFGNGVFAGVSYEGVILTSPDGINWQERFTEPGEALSGISFNNGVFMAVSGQSGRTYVSTDGLYWRATGGSFPQGKQPSEGYWESSGLFYYYVNEFPGCYTSICAYKGTFLIGGPEGKIMQSGQIPPSLAMPQVSSNKLTFIVDEISGAPFRVQSSSNLTQWVDDYSGIGASSPMMHSEPITNSNSPLFYRVIAGP